MNKEEIVKLCIDCFAKQSKNIARCVVGQGNYVYIVEFTDKKIVVRCGEETGVYKETIYWLERLAAIDIPADWTWKASFVDDMLVRAKERIITNGYFAPEKVERLMKAAEQLEDYFAGIKPVAYLDDISTKHLLIYKGRVTGVIDIDWMGIGDKLTYVAMTNMALLNMKYDTDYVTYLLEEMQLSEEERKAFI